MLYLINTLPVSVLSPVWVGLSTRLLLLHDVCSLLPSMDHLAVAHPHDIKHITGNPQVLPIPSFLTKSLCWLQFHSKCQEGQQQHKPYTQSTLPGLGGAALGKHPSASVTHKEEVSRGFALLLSLHSSHISFSPENSYALWVSSTLCLINKLNNNLIIRL